MNEICGDNRFEIIAKAKAHLLDATNIDTSEDEMKVLDSFLFRCWQMGWLDRYDRKTENNSEKPNNCEPQTIRCPKCGRTDYIRDMEKDMGVKDSHYKYKCINCNTYIKDEPTISKMEQVDRDINVLIKDEQTDCTEALTLLWIKNMVTDEEFYRIDARLKVMPQTERSE